MFEITMSMHTYVYLNTYAQLSMNHCLTLFKLLMTSYLNCK